MPHLTLQHMAALTAAAVPSIRLLLCMAALACALLTAACDKARPWSPGEPLPKEKIIIGVIHVDDAKSGYSYAHDNALRIMQEQMQLDDAQIIRKFNVNDADPIMVEHMMRECIDQGANIIVATSWGHIDVCAKLAPLYPNVIFTNATGTKHNSTNLTNYFGRMYQPRYLSGIVAGLKTKTNKLGFVAAMDKNNSEVTSGINAFALGVESVNPKARVLVKVTNSWFDPAAERLATQRLLAEGCDVITQHCNTRDPQIQAEKAGAWGIGYNSDMSADAPKAVLTSVIWKWEVYYIRLVKSVIEGSFTTAPYLGNLKDGMVDMVPLNEALASPSIIQAVAVARENIENKDFNIFDGPLRTNDGATISSEGKALEDAEIISGMHWYYHTVKEITAARAE